MSDLIGLEYIIILFETEKGKGVNFYIKVTPFSYLKKKLKRKNFIFHIQDRVKAELENRFHLEFHRLSLALGQGRFLH